MLPDELLLEIFDFYVCGAGDKEKWMTLVHVCRRWRYIVFASPHRLALRLVCTDTTPVREMLHIWPAFPITVRISDLYKDIPEDVVATLEHNDRVYGIYADRIPGAEFEELISMMMQDPFPALTHLYLEAYLKRYDTTPIIPDSFLGGSAPLLRSLNLISCEYPALPKLLLSATGLVSLSLFSDRWYISPQMLVGCLTSLTKLEKLQIEFLYWRPESCPQPHPPPLAQRTDPLVLPMLATLAFEGETEYFDQLFARIDAPQLEDIRIQISNPSIFDLSRVFLLTSLKETFEELDQVYMGIETDILVNITFSSRSRTAGGEMLMILMKPRNYGLNWKLWKLKHDRRRRPTPPSPADFELPHICEGGHTFQDVGNDRWLDLFRPLSALRNLYLSERFAICVAPALRELVGKGVTEVLPTLQNLFIRNFQSSKLVKEAIGEFVAARELSGHPVIVQSWTDEIGSECRESGD
jgi:hypothetical protein